MTGPYFPDFKDIIPGAEQVLAWDFGDFLPVGVTLSSPTVTITVNDGVNATPTGELSGAASVGTVTVDNGGTGKTSTSVLQKMIPTIGGVKYLCVVKAARSDGDKSAAVNHIRVVTPE